MTDPAAQADAVPGTRRSFGGTVRELVHAPEGYVLKPDTSRLHRRSCAHAHEHDAVPWAADDVVDAWLTAPDEPLNQVRSPGFCHTCLGRHVGAVGGDSAARSPESIAAVGAAARVVLDHLFGDSRSVIDPAATIWTAKSAEAIRSALEDSPDAGGGTTFDRLRDQLAHRSREVVLLTAELIYLRGIPLINVSTSKKLEHISTVLSWLPDPPEIPEAMVQGASTGGTFRGGQGYNQQLWLQIVWLARFVVRWTLLSDEQRAAAQADPWAFRRVVVDSDRDLPMMRNTLLFLAFPETFESITNDGHKYAIRRAFAHVIGGRSGDDGEALDRDLLAIRTTLQEQTDERIGWYDEPWRSQWDPPAERTGDRAWAVRPRPGGRELAEDWVAGGFVSLAATHLGDVEAGSELAVVRKAVAVGYDHQDYAQQIELTNDYFVFLTRMQVGDVVAARVDDQVWFGRVASEASDAAEVPRLRRDVAWIPTPRLLSDLPVPLPDLLSRTGTVLDITAGQAEAAAFLEAPEEENEDEPEVHEPPPRERLRLPGATPSLAADLHFSQDWLDEAITILDRRKQVILHGPPGTGKTYLAQAIARHVAGDAVRLVQFHPSYAYEDFFEGFRPTSQSEGRLSFELRPGPLRQIAAQASADPGTPHVLIIDEINRGNIAKVFGELYFLLEYRGSSISLQYSSDVGKEFQLPANLYLIGTMNTADRSIAMIDAAIRRRFAFIEMHPEIEPVAGLLERWLEANLKPVERAHLLRAFNAELGEEHRDFQIGPSYLMRGEAEEDGGLERIWRHDLLPLLEEHFYGRLTSLQIMERFGLPAIRRRALPAADLTYPVDDAVTYDSNLDTGQPDTE